MKIKEIRVSYKRKVSIFLPSKRYFGNSDVKSVEIGEELLAEVNSENYDTEAKQLSAYLKKEVDGAITACEEELSK